MRVDTLKLGAQHDKPYILQLYIVQLITAYRCIDKRRRTLREIILGKYHQCMHVFSVRRTCEVEIIKQRMQLWNRLILIGMHNPHNSHLTLSESKFAKYQSIRKKCIYEVFFLASTKTV